MLDIAVMAATTTHRDRSQGEPTVGCAVRVLGVQPDTCASCPFGHVLETTPSGRVLKVACDLRCR